MIRSRIRDCLDIQLPEKGRFDTGDRISVNTIVTPPARRSCKRARDTTCNEERDSEQTVIPADWLTITDKDTGQQVKHNNEVSLSMEVDAKYKGHAFQACAASTEHGFVLKMFVFASGFSESRF